MKRFMNKKVAAIGVAAGLALGIGGAAFAYFTTTGAGNGSTTAGANSGSITLHATIAGNILPGDGGQSVTFTGDNSNTTTALFVKTISFVSVTSSDTNCQAVITANPTQFHMADVTSNTSVPASGSGVALNGTGTLIWDNSNTQDQTACAGASLTLNVSSN
jgi:hypothetical protein